MRNFPCANWKLNEQQILNVRSPTQRLTHCDEKNKKTPQVVGDEEDETEEEEEEDCWLDTGHVEDERNVPVQ